MVLVQKWPFFQLFFFRKYRPEKCRLRYSRAKKTPFLAIKTRSPKNRKIDIFPKGLTHGFGAKMAIFPTFFFLGNMGHENGFCDNLEQKKSLSRLYKQKVQKVEKLTFFFRGFTHGFGPKMAIFLTFFFRQYRPGK